MDPLEEFSRWLGGLFKGIEKIPARFQSQVADLLSGLAETTQDIAESAQERAKIEREKVGYHPRIERAPKQRPSRAKPKNIPIEQPPEKPKEQPREVRTFDSPEQAIAVAAKEGGKIQVTMEWSQQRDGYGHGARDRMKVLEFDADAIVDKSEALDVGFGHAMMELYGPEIAHSGPVKFHFSSLDYGQWDWMEDYETEGGY